MRKNSSPPNCPKCKNPKRSMIAKSGGRRFRCDDCDLGDPLNCPDVKKLLNGELRPPK
jgi:hypothetical protein